MQDDEEARDLTKKGSNIDETQEKLWNRTSDPRDEIQYFVRNVFIVVRHLEGYILFEIFTKSKKN